MKPTIILLRNTHPNFYGGAETYQLALARELRASGYRPLILTSSKSLLSAARGEKFAAIRAPYLRQQNWSGLRNLLLPFYAFWQLRLYFWYKSLFKKYRPLAVNIQSRDDWLAATRAARRLHIRTLWTDHMDFRTWALTNVNHPLKNLIGKRILKTAKKVHRIIFISDFERNYFDDLTCHTYDNLLTIKNGTADHRSDYANIQPIQNSLCYVGRLVDYKGIKELLAAFAKVRATHSSATLHVYGDGDPSLITKIENTVGAIYHGFTNDPLRAIAENQIFILPSYREGLSLSLLDAAMLGRAIIATNIDGNPEVVLDGQTGLLVPAKNATALAQAITQLLDDPELAHRLAKNARAHYEQNFNFSQTIKTTFLPLLKML